MLLRSSEIKPLFCDLFHSFSTRSGGESPRGWSRSYLLHRVAVRRVRGPPAGLLSSSSEWNLVTLGLLGRLATLRKFSMSCVYGETFVELGNLGRVCFDMAATIPRERAGTQKIFNVLRQWDLAATTPRERAVTLGSGRARARRLRVWIGLGLEDLGFG